MKIFNVKRNAPCLVVANVESATATFTQFRTTKSHDFDYPFLDYRTVYNGYGYFADAESLHNWNQDVLKEVWKSAEEKGMYAFTLKNKKNETSLMLVGNEFVEVLC